MQKLKKGMRATFAFLAVYGVAAVVTGRMGASEQVQAWVSMVLATASGIAYVCYVHVRQRNRAVGT